MEYFKKIGGLILDIFFPRICLGCRGDLKNEEKLVCARCLDSIIINRNPLKRNGATVYAATSYDEPIKTLIHAMKFDGLKEVSEPLSIIVGTCFLRTELFFKNREEMTIVPMPLHFLRRWKRGFNQAEEIAILVGRMLGIEIETKAIRRLVYRKPQSEIKSDSERLENVKNCFSAGKRINSLSGKIVILLDDVVTSGATISEAIKIIKTARPKEIICLSVASAKN